VPAARRRLAKLELVTRASGAVYGRYMTTPTHEQLATLGAAFEIFDVARFFGVRAQQFSLLPIV
jgi:hypothetical protein